MSEHVHTDACWEPNSGCDMGRSEAHARRSTEPTSDELTKRYTARDIFGDGCHEADDGEYVLASDYDALAAELAAVKAHRGAHQELNADLRLRLNEAERLLREITDEWYREWCGSESVSKTYDAITSFLAGSTDGTEPSK